MRLGSRAATDAGLIAQADLVLALNAAQGKDVTDSHELRVLAGIRATLAGRA